MINLCLMETLCRVTRTIYLEPGILSCFFSVRGVLIQYQSTEGPRESQTVLEMKATKVAMPGKFTQGFSNTELIVHLVTQHTGAVPSTCSRHWGCSR